jgi:hypothetical protein
MKSLCELQVAGYALRGTGFAVPYVKSSQLIGEGLKARRLGSYKARKPGSCEARMPESWEAGIRECLKACKL